MAASQLNGDKMSRCVTQQRQPHEMKYETANICINFLIADAWTLHRRQLLHANACIWCSPVRPTERQDEHEPQSESAIQLEHTRE